MIRIKQKGSFKHTERYFKRKRDFRKLLHRCGREGVEALASATPIDTGETANSWDYVLVKTSSGYEVHWINKHVEDGVSIALILQYGHGTRTGSWVNGRDYINPAIQPIFDNFAEEAWKEVK